MPGYAHDVTQRGNYRQDVFEDDEDRQTYLRNVNEKPDGIIDDGLAVADMPKGIIGNWPEWLENKSDEKVIHRLHTSALTGRPCGSKRFISKIEAALCRILRPKKPGRPKKTKEYRALSPIVSPIVSIV